VLGRLSICIIYTTATNKNWAKNFRGGSPHTEIGVTKLGAFYTYISIIYVLLYYKSYMRYIVHMDTTHDYCGIYRYKYVHGEGANG